MAPIDDSDNCVPRLVNRADFKNWTIRLKHHLCSIDNDLWKSIDKGPNIPVQTAPDSASTYTKDSTKPYPEDDLQGEDLRIVKNESKVYSLMCKGMPLQVLSRLDAYQTGYTMFKALTSICEGGEHIRSLKKQKLKRQLKLFEHISGETVHQMMNRFVHLTTEMTNVGVKTDLQDLNDRLLCALPSSWKQTVTLMKHTEKFPMDLDLLIAKIEEVVIDESSRNTDRSGSHAQYKFVVNPSNTVENAFLVQDGIKSEDEGDLFVGASFYIDSSYQTSSPIYMQPQSPPKAQPQSMKSQSESQSSSSTVQGKVKDVMNILLQDDETKNAFTAFMASFQAYQGSHLTQLDVVLQDLFEMDPDDVEEMDLNWQMVMVAYRTQKDAYVTRNFKPSENKTNQNQGQSQNSQQSSSYQNRHQRFHQKTYQSLPMPELKDEGKQPEDQNKALVVSVKDGYDWSAYAEQFTANLTSSLALVCEIVEEDWFEEGDIKVLSDDSHEPDEYDWSAKADPTEELEAEIALMATSQESFSSAESEQPKVSYELPPNYVPVPDDVKDRTGIVTKQLEEMTKALELEKIAYAATQVDLTKMKSLKVILAKLASERKDNKAEGEVMLIEADDEASEESSPVLEQEQKELVAAKIHQRANVRNDGASTSKSQKSKKSTNQSKTKQEKGKNIITSNENSKITKAQSAKSVTKNVSKLLKPMKFVSAVKFDMNSSQSNQTNSKIKSLSDLKTNSGPKTFTVKRFSSKYCDYCNKRNHSSAECYYNKFCEICERRNHDTSDYFFWKTSSGEMTRFPNFQRNKSFGFQNSTDSHSLDSRPFRRINSEFNDMPAMQFQTNKFTPRAVMVVPQRNENNLDPKFAQEDLLTHGLLTKHEQAGVRNRAVGIPSKKFSTTDHCLACLKGKQHRISFNAPRTPQQNGVAERKNWTLIEAARSMLADAKLSFTFWDEAIVTACFVQNMTLLVQDKHKTPYELLFGRKPNISYLKAFGCPITILNLSDHLGKFESKSDDGFFLGCSSTSKAYRVFNRRTNVVLEYVNVQFLENFFPSVAHGPDWLFDLDSLSKSLNSNLFDFSGKSKKEPRDLGSFSDNSDNDDDDDLNPEYPFMSFHDPHVESSNHSQDPSVSQEAQESNNDADLSN
ncbi:hypothetical protein QVD17_30414 [Tagetes erecta]|uniref:Integrase catalytic domain-containing protein n=1 Tax=Tagetes erecta TaxID=13708 RepID=A0AAD8K1H4_TARER|nr:hypothetical protein QVD17_30414 [Tagetes erecta]